jgi:phosphate transport system permease protein
VRAVERLARGLITFGGIGTILAVGLIFACLVAVVVPLFLPARAGDAGVVGPGPSPPADAPASAVRLGVDEYASQAWRLSDDGALDLVRVGEPGLEAFPRLELAAAVASLAQDGSTLTAGLADGRVQVARVAFSARFLAAPDDERPELRALAPGERLAVPGGLVERTPAGQLREQRLSVDVEAPLDVGESTPIVAVARVTTSAGEVLATCARGPGTELRLALHSITRRENLLTRKLTVKTARADVPFAPPEGAGPPDHLLLTGGGDNLLVAWDDGRLLRFDARDLEQIQLAEAVDLVPEGGESLTVLSPLIGGSTFVAGDSLGRARAWFRTKPADAGTPDGATLTRAREFVRGAGAGRATVTSLASSARQRVLAIGYSDGRALVAQATTGERLLELDSSDGAPLAALALSPRDDLLLAATGVGLVAWPLELGHAEAGVAAFFTRQWYEGYEGPEHVWQSSSGTDDFEPKLGLVPLIFGTLKATLYSMLFGAPLAILAALYTSEFLGPRLKSSVKPFIETMASLPSVVLGFLAAVVIAPAVASVVPATLAAFACVPLCMLAGAYAWQLLPQETALRVPGRWKLAIIALSVPIGVLLASVVGPWIERRGFGGDLLGWLDGRGEGCALGWAALLLPLAALITFAALGEVFGPWLRATSAGWSRSRCASVDAARFAIGIAVTGLLAWLMGVTLDGLGADPRGNVIGTYVQRNALIVGFLMGFAIIPIIYTITEDALSSVPASLRLASLGAGATPWQTAVRVVLPTAMSGVFSALMIGLGRAVGETMIVLMATGNTPVMSWNAFNGFRTLSANIAVELPEAVQGSTHYRTLFLAALTLFAMTFAVNSLAEIVRQRVRKRAFQL